LVLRRYNSAPIGTELEMEMIETKGLAPPIRRHTVAAAHPAGVPPGHTSQLALYYALNLVMRNP
jgi:hypothetical protein